MKTNAVPAAVEHASCFQARRMLSLVLDGEAASAEVRALALHLGGCELCRQYVARVAVATRELRASRVARPGAHGTTAHTEGGRS